jgi:uncharacterized membrane protein YraQ (UPF0718 family)
MLNDNNIEFTFIALYYFFLIVVATGVISALFSLITQDKVYKWIDDNARLSFIICIAFGLSIMIVARYF